MHWYEGPVSVRNLPRPGDLARIEENVTTSGPSKKGTKTKKPVAEGKISQSVEGVVYKVTTAVLFPLTTGIMGDEASVRHIGLFTILHNTSYDIQLTFLLKVSDTRIVIAVDGSDSSSDDLDLPERCRVVKLANSVTYDRYVAKSLYY